MTADIRMDRLARPQWEALPEGVRREVEDAIPDGCYMTIVSTHWGGHDYHARIFRGHELVSESLRCRYVEVAAWQALRMLNRSAA